MAGYETMAFVNFRYYLFWQVDSLRVMKESRLLSPAQLAKSMLVGEAGYCISSWIYVLVTVSTWFNIETWTIFHNMRYCSVNQIAETPTCGSASAYPLEILEQSKRGEMTKSLRSEQLAGGFKPSEKYISQVGWLFPIHGQIKNVPKHHPDTLVRMASACPWLIRMSLDASCIFQHLEIVTLWLFNIAMENPL